MKINANSPCQSFLVHETLVQKHQEEHEKLGRSHKNELETMKTQLEDFQKVFAPYFDLIGRGY